MLAIYLKLTSCTRRSWGVFLTQLFLVDACLRGRCRVRSSRFTNVMSQFIKLRDFRVLEQSQFTKPEAGFFFFSFFFLICGLVDPAPATLVLIKESGPYKRHPHVYYLWTWRWESGRKTVATCWEAWWKLPNPTRSVLFCFIIFCPGQTRVAQITTLTFSRKGGGVGGYQSTPYPREDNIPLSSLPASHSLLLVWHCQRAKCTLKVFLNEEVSQEAAQLNFIKLNSWFYRCF